jgi:hypothetical protein
MIPRPVRFFSRICERAGGGQIFPILQLATATSAVVVVVAVAAAAAAAVAVAAAAVAVVVVMMGALSVGTPERLIPLTSMGMAINTRVCMMTIAVAAMVMAEAVAEAIWITVLIVVVVVVALMAVALVEGRVFHWTRTMLIWGCRGKTGTLPWGTGVAPAASSRKVPTLEEVGGRRTSG